MIRDERFQSTLPVRGATTRRVCGVSAKQISIHAPRAGSDHRWSCMFCLLVYFNPRSPCGERQMALRSILRKRHFNPRSPCGERLLLGTGSPCFTYFNPRSPCGERPAARASKTSLGIFQSTLPVRGATHAILSVALRAEFQSTLPVRGATGGVPEVLHDLGISIHAPRAGSDCEFRQCIPQYGMA